MKREHFIIGVLFLTIHLMIVISCSSNYINDKDNLSLITQENKTKVLDLYKSYLDGAFLYLDSRGKSINFTKDEVKSISSLKEYSENVKTNEEIIEYVTSQINSFIQENSSSIIKILKTEYDSYFSIMNTDELNTYIQNNNRYITLFIYNNINEKVQNILKDKLKDLNSYDIISNNWNNMMTFYKGVLLNQNKNELLTKLEYKSDINDVISKLYYIKIKNELIAGETLVKGNKI